MDTAIPSPRGIQKKDPPDSLTAVPKPPTAPATLATLLREYDAAAKGQHSRYTLPCFFAHATKGTPQSCEGQHSVAPAIASQAGIGLAAPGFFNPRRAIQ